LDQDGTSRSEDLPMFDFDQLRSRQEQRLLLVLDSWNEAKEQLEKAIALAENKEREYREVSDDVRRRLDALDLVSSMARELGGEIPAERSLNGSENQPMLMPPPENGAGELKAVEKAETPVPLQNGPPEPPAFAGMMRTTSRPLFPSHVRSRFARLSILQ
jgi:hypothetical protein